MSKRRYFHKVEFFDLSSGKVVGAVKLTAPARKREDHPWGGYGSVWRRNRIYTTSPVFFEVRENWNEWKENPIEKKWFAIFRDEDGFPKEWATPDGARPMFGADEPPFIDFSEAYEEAMSLLEDEEDEEYEDVAAYEEEEDEEYV